MANEFRIKKGLIVNETDLYVSGSKAGIGTVSPTASLHVNGGTDNLVGVFESSDSLSYVSFKDSATTSYTSVALGASGNNFTVYTGTAFGQERMRIDSSGNLGIGNNNPPEKLTVAGNISGSGDITIRKNEPTIRLVDNNTANTNFPRIIFDTNNNQGVMLYHDEFDIYLPEAGYGLVLGPSPNNTQFPGTGNLTLQVLGSIYADSETTGSGYKVLTTADEGSGNGIDADTVDGLEASQFLRSDADDTTTGFIAAGNAAGTSGAKVLRQRYSGDDTIATLGTMQSSGNWLLAYGIDPKNGSSGYVSSFDNFSGKRSAIEVGNDNIEIHYAPAQATAVGSDITGLTTPFIFDLTNTRMGIGTDTPSVVLEVADVSPQIQFTDTVNASAYSRILATDAGGLIIDADKGNAGTSSYISLRVDDTERVNIDSTGAVIIKSGLLYLGEADTASGHLNSYELMTFNIDTDNDDTNRYFAWYKDGAAGGGTHLMRLTEAGALGIGTDAPTGKFNSYISAARQITHNGNGGDLSIISDNNSTPVMYIKGTGTADLLNVFDNTTEVFTILDGGNVGIGETTPASLLHLSGSSNNAIVTLENNGNGNVSGIDFVRERSTGPGVNGGSLFLESNTGNNNSFVYLQAQTAGAEAGVTSALTAANGVRLILKGGQGIFSVETGASETFKVDNGDATLTGDLTVGGKVTAQEFHTEFVSASIIYQSGSTKFGDTTDDIHAFTGSINLFNPTSTTGTTGTTLQTLTNYVGSDLSQQKTFIDFIFKDDNANYTPQVRIGAEVGENGDANAISKEGSGAFIVYTSEGTDEVGSGTISEKFRVDYRGNVGIGTTSPTYGFVVANQTTANSATGTMFVGASLNGSGKGLVIDSTTRTTGDNNVLALEVVNRAGGNTMAATVAGNVGIGTTSPSSKLHVEGNISGSGTLTVQGDVTVAKGDTSGKQTYHDLYIGGTGLGSTDSAIYIGNQGDGTGYGWELFYSGSGSGNENKLVFISENLGSPNNVMTMLQDGNVGIGTTSPSTKLDVNGTTTSDKFVSLINSDLSSIGVRDWLKVGTYSRGAGVEIGDVDGARYAFWAGGYDLTFGKHISTTDTYTTVMQFLATGATDSSIDVVFPNNNVGIGTTTPSQKLTVAGTISGSSDLSIDGNSVFDGTVGYNTFNSGFGGNGWRIDSNANAEFENLTVRGTFSVYELLAQQIRATNGSLLVATSGKVDTVTGTTTGTLTFDTGNVYGHGFLANDIILAQRLDTGGTSLKRTFLRVDSRVDSGSLTYTKLSGDNPEAGQEFVRIGNTTDTDRQGHIYLTADDNFAPYIGVRDGVNAYTDFTSGTGSVEKVRVGRLDGVTSANFGSLSGYGLWASGSVYLEGGINATSGKIADLNITSTKIYTGAGNFNNADTGFYVDNSSNFSLGSKFSWNGSALTIDGNITATAGNIGGFTISSDALSGTNFYLSGSATGNEFFISSSNFNVKANGDLTGSRVLLEGGQIVSFPDITTLYDRNGNIAKYGDLDLDGTVDFDDAIRIFQYDNDLRSISSYQFFLGDTNGDDYLRTEDLIQVLNYASGQTTGTGSANIPAIDTIDPFYTNVRLEINKSGSFLYGTGQPRSNNEGFDDREVFFQVGPMYSRFNQLYTSYLSGENIFATELELDRITSPFQIDTTTYTSITDKTTREVGLTGSLLISHGIVDADANSSALVVDGPTTLNDDLIVDTDTLFVDASEDKVGIGTTQPDATLHISESGASVSREFKFFGSPGEEGSAFRYVENSVATLSTSNFYIQDADNNSSRGTLRITGNNGNVESLFVASNGNVGIGSINPGHNLTVSGSTTTAENNPLLYLQHSFTGDYGFGLGIGRNNQAAVSALVLGADSSNDAIIATNNGELRIGRMQSTTLNEYIRVDTSGNVGIGDTTPSNTLVLKRSSSGQGEFGLRYEYTDTDGPTNTSAAVLVGAYGMKFKNYNSSRDFLFETGDVGINTSSPSAKLHVVDTVEEVLRIDSGTTGAIHFFNGATRRGILGYSNGTSISSTAELGDMILRAETGQRVHLGVAGGVALTVDDNDRVGIGTIEPSSKLHVADTTTMTSGQSSVEVLKLQRIDATGDIKASTEGHISMWATDGNSDNEWARISWLNDNASDSGAENEGSLHFWTNTGGTLGRKMSIDHDGNVGIGLTSPDDKLHVQGNVFLTDGSPEITLETTSATHYNWQIAAQENVDGALEFSVGSQDADASNDTFSPLMVIKNTGYVGIGETTPTYRLHVVGNSYIDADSASANLTLGRYTGQPTIKAGTDDGGYLIMDSTGGRAALNWYSGDHVILANGGGNVGIGTTSPAKLLHVEGNGVVHGNLQISGSKAHIHFNRPTGASVGAIGWDDTDTVFYVAGHPDYGSAAGNVVRVYGFGSDVRLGDNTNGDVLTVDATNGNVGIGTTTPTSGKLQVEGNIFANGGDITGSNFRVGEYIHHAGDANTYIRFQPDDISLIAAGNNLFRVDNTAPLREIVVNEAGAATNFRIESDTVTDAFFVTASNGYVGIGTSSPEQTLDVDGTVRVQSTGAATLILDGDTNNSGDTGNTDSIIDMRHDAGAYGMRLSARNFSGKSAFRIQENRNGSYSERFYIDEDGDVGIGTITPSSKLDVAGDITTSGNLIVASGQGIDFSATTDAGGMTSELLDDYEEGTWTPAYKGRSGSTIYNPTAGSTSNTSATYTKIGNKVFFSCYMRSSGITFASTGYTLVVDNLPFVCGEYTSVGISYADQFAGDYPAGGYVENGQDYIVLTYRNTSDGDIFGMNTGDLSNGTDVNDIMIAGFYTI